MDRLLAMEMFVRVVETGSFSKAAKEFATTQPTVTKQVAATEARLKVRLLNRNTRGVSLTESGALYYERCKLIVHQAQEADSIVHLRQTQAQGLLRIGTSVAFGRRVVVPLALDFMARNPQVQVDLSFEDRYTDLIAQGIDVAVRMGKLSDSTLGARFLGMNPWVLVAAPKYIKKHGTPKRPQDLSGHNALIYSSVQGDDVWRLSTSKGAPVTVPVTGRLRSNTSFSTSIRTRCSFTICVKSSAIWSMKATTRGKCWISIPSISCAIFSIMPMTRSSASQPSWARSNITPAIR